MILIRNKNYSTLKWNSYLTNNMVRKEEKLIEELKSLAKAELEKNERFHDWGMRFRYTTMPRKLLQEKELLKRLM